MLSRVFLLSTPFVIAWHLTTQVLTLSAKTGEGLPDLKEALLMQAEVFTDELFCIPMPA